MRSLLKMALFAAACTAAVPAAAQVTSPGPVYYNQSGAPIPGAPYASPNPPSYNPPVMTTGGPVYANQQPYDPAGPAYYNQSGAPIPGAPMRAMPANTGGPLYAGAPNQAYGPGGNRWGGNVGGRWWGGSQAPGGWGGYHRPRRGGQLPPYWLSPNFQIPDYLSFGLSAPPYGFYWVRYYDDAVLVDAQGGVQASVSGIAWSSASASAGAGYASSSASASASAGGYGGQQGGPIGYVDPNPPYYAGPQGGYAPPGAYGPPAVQVSGGCPQVCPQVYTQQGGGYGYNGGYYSGGGYYGGGSTTTTVVIQSPPVVTTTIVEEVVEEEVVTTRYVRSAPRRVYRAPVRHRPRPRPCSCSCACR
ncbi:RcnB family protein [Sphingomonas sp. LB-2]|uniref:RcnB family protein n=1 Tax=Sphingomonas caeni TaxID=2984949 RepID=UPI00222F4FBA|nr:RcnB family protein [Sphingomonas caeni]MCW3845829.1 RcnB family protein [Sphingomonas caeni]